MPEPDPALDPNRPQVGDEIRIEDDLTVGDLCYFDRNWDGIWLVKRLDDLSEWSYDRPLLTLAPGDEPQLRQAPGGDGGGARRAPGPHDRQFERLTAVNSRSTQP